MPTRPRSQTDQFHLDAPRDRVFPLFTARGERDWVPGWDPKILSGGEERGSAFQTYLADQTTTWIVIDYRPAEGRASYARLAQGSNIGLVDVTCTASQSGGTEVRVAYTLTPLTEAGAVYVEEFLDPPRYRRMLEEWRAAIARTL
jgi:hypothetical protein